jgi:hypothetical protein
VGIYIELMRVEPQAAQAAVAGRSWPSPEMLDGERFRALLSLNKAWNALQWLLAASGCPADPVMGTPFLEDRSFDYASPGLLTAEEVVQAADFLAGLDFDTLADFADEEAMDADDVYPSGYDRQRAEELRGHYADSPRILRGAATAEQWVLTTLT